MQPPGLRSGLDTADLLAAAVQRASHVRSELVRLREQATSAAVSGPDSSLGGGTSSTAQCGGGEAGRFPAVTSTECNQQTPKALALELLQQYKAGTMGPVPEDLHVVSPSIGGGKATPARMAAAGSPGVSKGEHQAPPLSAGGTIERRSSNSNSWTIASYGGRQQASDLQDGSGLTPPAPSFEHVVAALREQAGQPQGAASIGSQALLSSTSGGTVAGGFEAPLSTSAASGSISFGSTGSMQSNGKAERPAGARSQRQSYRQQAASVNLTAVEQQLRAKMEKVNAAKRNNDSRMKSGIAAVSTPDAAPAAKAPVVPRLPLNLLRPGSAGSSQAGSARPSGREAEQQAQPSAQQAARAPSPLRSGKSQHLAKAASPLRPGKLPTHAQAGAGVSTLSPAQQARSGGRARLRAVAPRAAAAPAEDATGQQVGRKQTHISLASLLAKPAANGGSKAGAAVNAGRQPEPTSLPRERTSRVTFASPQKPAADRQRTAVEAAAGVLPGEAAAPPLLDTPGSMPPVQRTPRLDAPVLLGAPARIPAPRQLAAAAPIAASGFSFGRLISPCGKLLSPPATPLEGLGSVAEDGGGDGAMQAVAPPTAASSSSSSSGPVSTASSGSPDQRLEQQQDAAVSPLRAFPALEGSTPSKDGADGSRQLAAAQALQQELSMQGAAASTGACSRVGAVLSTPASIRRKRSGHELGAPPEQPSSAKKHSPGVDRNKQALRSTQQGGVGPAAPKAGKAEAEQGRQEQTGAGALPAEPEPEPLVEDKEQRPQHMTAQKPAVTPVRKGQRGRALAAAGTPARQRSAQGTPASVAGGSNAATPATLPRLVLPVVLDHSPTRRRGTPKQQHKGATPMRQGTPLAPRATPLDRGTPLLLDNSPRQRRQPAALPDNKAAGAEADAGGSSTAATPVAASTQRDQQPGTARGAPSAAQAADDQGRGDQQNAGQLPATPHQQPQPAATPQRQQLFATPPHGQQHKQLFFTPQVAQPPAKQHQADQQPKTAPPRAASQQPPPQQLPSQRPPDPQARAMKALKHQSPPPQLTPRQQQQPSQQQQQQQAQQQPFPKGSAEKQRRPATRPSLPPLMLQAQLLHRSESPAKPPLPPQAAAMLAAARAATPQKGEQELPSESRWVSASGAPVAPRLQVDALPEMESTSMLIGNLSPREAYGSLTPRDAAAYGYLTPRDRVGGGGVWPPPGSADRASVGRSSSVGTPVGVRPAASPITITPRRRSALLEPPVSGQCLRDDMHGKELLSNAPQLASVIGKELLENLRQGRIVRKAWVKPNFKQGGSVRCIQLAPGREGKPEMLYPSGLLRKPLRFTIKRAILNGASWRPGVYIVVDTARGMLRLEPASAHDYARWVLGLNAAFLASTAGTSSGSSVSPFEGGDSPSKSAVTRQTLGDMRWSDAILFG